MPTYPRLYLNGQWVPSGDGKINLSDSSPVRQATVAPENFVPVIRGTRVYYPPDGIDFPLFSIKFLVMGQGTTADDKIADCENSLASLTALCCTRDLNELYLYPSQSFSSDPMYGRGTLVSFDRQESPRDYALVTVVYRLDRPFWRSQFNATQTLNPNSGTTFTLSADFNCSAPIFGPQIDILGPITNPRIIDLESGSGILVNTTIPAGATMSVLTWNLNAIGGVANPTNYVSAFDNNPVAGLATLARRFRLTNRPLTAGANPTAWRPQVQINGQSINANTRVTITGPRQFR